MASTERSQSDISSAEIFFFLWGAAALFHNEWPFLIRADIPLERTLLALLLTIAGTLLAVRPRSTPALLFLALAQVLDVIVFLPEIPNHWMLVFFVNTTLLLSALNLSLIEEKKVTSIDILSYARPVIFLEVAIFYFFTFFWKLNDDFISLETSCGVIFLRHVQDLLPLFPAGTWFDEFVMRGTLVVELFLPFLLIFRRTRSAAVLMALVFHFFLALDFQKIFLNFSSVMFALLFIYLPTSFVETFARELPSRLRGKLAAYSRLFLQGYLGIILLAFCVGASQGAVIYAVGRYLLWLCFSSIFLVLLCSRVKTVVFQRAVEPAALRSPWLAAVVLLVLLNGVSPMVGLKTRSSWQMYSNIRIDNNSSNHLLGFRSLDLAGKLAERVDIIATSDEELQRDYADRDLGITLLELRRAIGRKPDFSLRYRFEGVEYEVASAKSDPLLGKPLGLLEGKLFYFAPLGENAGHLCLW